MSKDELVITNIEVHEPATLIILGKNFNHREQLTITLGGIGDISADCVLQSPNMITCLFLPAELPPAADYLLIVTNGKGDKRVDEFDMTIGGVGATGPQGEEGIQGPQGISGIPGSMGPIGMIGPQGEPGSPGETGPTGSSGEAGPQGTQGEPGSTGDTGPIGMTGGIGPRGLQGVPGSPGETGQIGLTGGTGPQGDPGIQGLQGPQGVAGEKGDPGPSGPSGVQARNIITVALEGGDFTSIQAAIDSVPETTRVTPTLIKIAPGEYYGQLLLRSNIHLRGSGRDQTIIGSPANPNNSCVFPRHVMCLVGADNVEISHLTITGLNEGGNFTADTAISIEESSQINIHDNRISQVFGGIRGEVVSNLTVRNKHITDSADGAVFISVVDESFASIVSNQMDQGFVNISGRGNAQIIGNRILGGQLSIWQGKLQVSGNQLIGRIEFLAEEDSLFSNNILFGSLALIGSKPTTVVGNSITPSEPGFAIEDNGMSTIVGNSLLSSTNPINSPPAGRSTIFANSYEGNAGEFPGHNSLVSRHMIVLESEQENVTIKAGGSTLVVDADGDITIDSAKDITLTADGDFTVNAREINLNSFSRTSIEGGTSLNLNAIQTSIQALSTVKIEAQSGGVDIDAASRVDIDAAAIVKIGAGGTVDIDGGIITLN